MRHLATGRQGRRADEIFSGVLAFSRALSRLIRPLATSPLRHMSSVCMPSAPPVWMAEYICATLSSRIRLRIAGVPIMIS